MLIVIYMLARRLMTFKEAMECVPKGFIAMVPPIIILTMAVSLKTMTSNLGAPKITGSGRKSLGFADGKPEDAAERTFEQIKEDVMGELKNAVRPEFLNRIDDIIVFNRLNEDEIAQIADGMLRKVAERMKDMEISMTWTEAAKKHLAKAGFDPLYGARPLRRAVTSEVEDLVAEESLEGRISKGSEVVLDVENGKLVLKTKDAETKAE